MNYCEIKKNDIANGEGVRVSLFVSGCSHKCKGCFNSVAWDFNYGESFNQEVENKIISYLENDYINGLSLLGGEPFEKDNQKALLPFLEKVKKTYPNKTIWCYTGFVLDKDLVSDGRAFCNETNKMLGLIDVLVDGPFIEEQKDISLIFRGSKNQRVIDLRKSLNQNKIVKYIE